LILEVQDIIFAAFLALILTYIIRTVYMVFKMITTNSVVTSDYRQMELEYILKKCYSLFPIETFTFNGLTIRRGMLVKAMVIGRKPIEGKFVGINKDNIICFLTHESVIAHELRNISDMYVSNTD